MPFDVTSSPVTPKDSSRLWTAGATAGVAVGVMVFAAAAQPAAAVWLLPGAVLVALSAWLLNRSGTIQAVAEEPDRAVAVVGAPAGLLESVFEAVDEPMLIVSGDEADDLAGRRIVLANRAARSLFRIPASGALLVSALRDPGMLEAIDEALFGEISQKVDYAPGGAKDRRWRASTGPLGAADDIRLALLVLRDETDARRMELMRVDFLANASHELRTPLASLSGFIETLKGHAKDDAVARDRFLDIMAVQAERMGRLVADLLSLSRIELNEHIPPSGRVRLERAAGDVVDAVSVLLRERDVSIRLHRDPADPDIVGERDEIVQVIQNLVDNAVKYSPSGGEVEITLRSGLDGDAAAAANWAGAARLSLVAPDHEPFQRYAAVTVRDFGPGMAREHLPRLTERFYRVEGQKSGERSGTGLGLAIVKHIVNRHGGGLMVESVKGEGAAFTAWFPMSRPPAVSEPTL
ncbi:PAS domain-containing protein [Brevundimonas sp. S30B]|uniref:sensor histidine kinase n=1 Tax=unclassified Brevundimonas TaxID=2622653 RepID=UPI001071A4D5|nr:MULTISPECIES: ATP-binding protein [unclassified Brevundimonas]QBX38971.1 PAS domain-containing protein [Brevundimonas sp. MF30-B]TFW01657.1 PAS domain-containing protein [Brevundimonas sp. S30B]